MRFDCGETWREKRARLGKWHRWFAWYPVKVGPHDCRWFEFVERSIEWDFMVFDTFKIKHYRPICYVERR